MDVYNFHNQALFSTLLDTTSMKIVGSSSIMYFQFSKMVYLDAIEHVGALFLGHVIFRPTNHAEGKIL